MTESSAARPGPAGFTLVEVLVTVVVIALGCLAALWMQSAAMRGNAQSDHLTAATSLAESEIERLRSLSFNELEKEIDDGGYDGACNIPAAGICLEGACPGGREQVLNRRGAVREDDDASTHPWPYTRTTCYYKQQPTSLSHQVVVRVAWRDAHGPHQVLYTAALTSFSLSGD